MIYLLDDFYGDNSHSRIIVDIIKDHSDEVIEIIHLTADISYSELGKIIINLFQKVSPSDIVLCPWVVNANEYLDKLFNDLSDFCWVVVAAGNFNLDIDNFSPARAEKVITVACLNKSGKKATLSNYSNNKKLEWIPGTNYDIKWKIVNGTSASCAIYSAFLANSIKQGNIELLSTYIQDYVQSVIRTYTYA